MEPRRYLPYILSLSIYAALLALIVTGHHYALTFSP